MILFIFSLAFIMLGHYFKALRQKIFYDNYHSIDTSILLKGLSLGYCINLFVPFRLGDLSRAWCIGKKEKGTGIAFALATVVWDRFFDIIVVGLLFGGLCFFHLEEVMSSVWFYLVLTIFLSTSLILVLKYSKKLKVAMYSLSSIFNQEIALNILLFFWSLITSFRDVTRNINIKRLLSMTILMWVTYLTSYYLFAEFVSLQYHEFSFLEIIILFFSQASADTSSFSAYTSYQELTLVLLVYSILPNLLFLILVHHKNSSNIMDNPLIDTEQFTDLLPQADRNAQLSFLSAYFLDEDKSYIQFFLEINQDIVVIQDYSAGSNATTMLCVKNDLTFFRKYQYGDGFQKLKWQYQWLCKYKNTLPLPKLLDCHEGEKYFSYDMEYTKNSLSFFQFIHSYPLDLSLNLLQQVTSLLSETIHNEKINTEAVDLRKYIREKVTQNIQIMKNSRLLKELMQYQMIKINGKAYNNFSHFEQYLQEDLLMSVFRQDPTGVIHGDLTVENIICYNQIDGTYGFFLIDPNAETEGHSVFLDYAKLLQSLHGGYEFIMKTKGIEIDKNNISFESMVSTNYTKLFEHYKMLLSEKFTQSQIKSIFYHEIIHWLRLMPYKLKKEGKRSVLFYCAMVMVMNDIIEEFEVSK